MGKQEIIQYDDAGRTECACCGSWQAYRLCEECVDTLALVIGNIMVHGSSSTPLTARQIQYIEHRHHWVCDEVEGGVTFWKRCNYAW